MTNEIEFVLKDKFSYIFDGYEQFLLVDEKETIHNIDKVQVKNIYLWKCAKIGDKVKVVANGNRVSIEKLN